MRLGREELEDRLRQLDRAVGLLYPGRSFRLVVVGGGALVMLGCLSRSTVDLDVLPGLNELTDLAASYDINSLVSAYTDHFPHGLEDRLVPLELGTTAVECFAASLEDVVTSKLASDRDTDARDVRRAEVLQTLDWQALDIAAAEMESSMLVARRYRQFRYNYEQYRKEYGHAAPDIHGIPSVVRPRPVGTRLAVGKSACCAVRSRAPFAGAVATLGGPDRPRRAV